MIDKKKQGKNNRKNGRDFELKVRKDMEREKWIISKWANNVEFKCTHKENCCAELKPARPQYNPFFKRIVGEGSGFPDFIAFKIIVIQTPEVYEVIGVECKINGYLDKVEKMKCQWLLDKNIFSRILIASKGKKRGEINYKEYGHN